MVAATCNTEDEKPWLQDLNALFCSFTFIPNGSKGSGQRINALTRLLVYVSIILILCQVKYWYIFLIGSAVLIACLYFYGKNEVSAKVVSDPTKTPPPSLESPPETFNFLPLLPRSIPYVNPNAMLPSNRNPRPIDIPLELAEGKTPLSTFASSIRSPNILNQARLLPLRSNNISNSYTNYEKRAIPTPDGLPGNRDSQAGIQYFTPMSGVNRRAMIQPVIAPRITDQDYWGKVGTVRSDINKLQIVDVTNEELNTSDMAQIPLRYPDAQGYKVGYPLALPVMDVPDQANGVWDMNTLNKDPDIGYYPSEENLFNSSNVLDFNRNILPIFENTNSYVFPKENMNLSKFNTTPTYQPWDRAISNNQFPVVYTGVTEQEVEQQSGAMCSTCGPSKPSEDLKSRYYEGFAFLPSTDQQFAPKNMANPIPTKTFGGNYTEMNRVPPGQNAQIPAITSQLMYQSPTRTYTDQYFNSSNERLFLNNVQPQLYSYNVEQTPINANLGISYAPQLPPRVLDQITSNDMNVPLYTRIDPQLVRTDGTPGQLASQPTRTNWSAEYSSFKPAPGSINFEDIYDPRFTSYGDPYRSYSDVNLGLVNYYYSDVDAYRMPNFISRSNVDFVDFRTPQGQIWPEYKRNVGIDEIRPHVESQVTADELFHREDLMTLQMDKRNREMWQLRLAPLNTNNNFY